MTQTLLKELRDDIMEMIDLSYKEGSVSQMIIKHSYINDKENYNPALAKVYKDKEFELGERINELKAKWL